MFAWNPAEMRRDEHGHATRHRPAQPRHFGQIDMAKAFARTGQYLDLWSAHYAFPQAGLLGGGVWDSWPARVVDALMICRAEFDALRAYVRTEEGG